MQSHKRIANLPMAIILVVVVLLTSAWVGAAANDRACSSLTVQTDKDSYMVSDPVVITINFVALLPGCVEPMIAHDYVIMIQVFNSENHVAGSFNRTTSGTIIITESWTATASGDYSVNATTWFRLVGNDLMMKTLQASKQIHVQDSAQSTMQGWIVALIVILIASPVFWIFKRNKAKDRQTR